MPRNTPAAIKRPAFTHSTPTAPSSTPVVIQRESSMMGAVKEGFGWGIGTSVARSLFGGGAPTTTLVKSEPTEFERCIAEHKDDIGVCAHLAQKK